MTWPDKLPGFGVMNIQRTSANTFLLSWPSSSTGFALQRTTILVAGNWVSLLNSTIVTSGQNQVLVALAAGRRFIRHRLQ